MSHPNIYRDVLTFNRECLPGMVDRTDVGLSAPSLDSMSLGLRLILEEVQELVRSMGREVHIRHDGKLDSHVDNKFDVDVVEAADAFADILYVVFGMAQRLGLSEEQFNNVWAEVTRCNMDKGRGPLRKDGKRLKPHDWIGPPNIKRALGLE